MRERDCQPKCIFFGGGHGRNQVYWGCVRVTINPLCSRSTVMVHDCRHVGDNGMHTGNASTGREPNACRGGLQQATTPPPPKKNRQKAGGHPPSPLRRVLGALKDRQTHHQDGCGSRASNDRRTETSSRQLRVEGLERQTDISSRRERVDGLERQTDRHMIKTAAGRWHRTTDGQTHQDSRRPLPRTSSVIARNSC
jgi:hypothetical protein